MIVAFIFISIIRRNEDVSRKINSQREQVARMRTVHSECDEKEKAGLYPENGKVVLGKGQGKTKRNDAK